MANDNVFLKNMIFLALVLFKSKQTNKQTKNQNRKNKTKKQNKK